MQKSSISKKTIAFAFVFALFAGLPNFVFSQNADVGIDYASNIGLIEPGTNDLRDLLVNIIRYFLGFVGIIAVAVILYAGFLWMTSAGRPDQLIKAKRTLLNGVVGLIIIIAAFAIVTLIVNLLGGGSGGLGSGRRPGGPPGGIGALGACAVESVYPAPGQRDVPRNTSIIVTFKTDVDPASLIGAGSSLNYQNVHIYQSAQGDSCQWTVDHWENCESTNLTDARAAQAGRIFVFTPSALMGNANGSTDYTVRLDQGILDQNGRSVFADCRTDSLIWSFEVSNRLDLVPPQVENNGVIPGPDNDPDAISAVPAVAAQGAAAILSQPQPSQAAAAAYVSGPALASGGLTAAAANSYDGEIEISVLPDGVTARFSGDGGAPLLGSAVFSGARVDFPGYFSLVAENAADVVAGALWEVALTARRSADTLTIGTITYSFVAGAAAGSEVVLGADISATAANAAAAINAGHPSVSAVAAAGTVSLSARVPGTAGNSLSLRTNNPARFAITPMSGGANASVSQATAGRPDPPRNIVIQANFNEAISPLTVSGPSSQVAGAAQVRCLSGDCAVGTFACGAYLCVSGRFEISNQYRTVEFIPEVECGVNSCGEQVYCLPPNSQIEVWFHAASLEPCANNSDCLSRQNFSTCSNLGGGQHCNNGTAYYPLSNLAAMDGLMDTANNSLDGNRDNDADGPASDYVENPGGQDPATGDNYLWRFYVSDLIDTVPPRVASIAPDINQAEVPLDSPLSLVFDKPMMSSSLKTGQSVQTLSGRRITHRHLNLWNYANRSVGYWITSANNFDAAGFPVSTTATINHSVFGPLLSYRAQAGSGVKDIYQNCYRPAAGPGCAGIFNSCCNGTGTAGETCD